MDTTCKVFACNPDTSFVQVNSAACSLTISVTIVYAVHMETCRIALVVCSVSPSLFRLGTAGPKDGFAAFV